MSVAEQSPGDRPGGIAASSGRRARDRSGVRRSRAGVGDGSDRAREVPRDQVRGHRGRVAGQPERRVLPSPRPVITTKQKIPRRRAREMADRVAHVIWAKPRRRVGFGLGLAVFVAAVAVLASGLSTASPAASTNRASAVAADQQAIAGKVELSDRPDDGRREVRPARDGGPEHAGRQRSDSAGREGGDRLGARPDRCRQHQPGPARRARAHGWASR